MQGQCIDNMLRHHLLYPNKHPKLEDQIPAGKSPIKHEENKKDTKLNLADKKPKQEEEKKISPSKQAAQPPRPQSAKKPQGMKELMAKPDSLKWKPLTSDELSDYTNEAISRYSFFLDLFTIVRQTGKKVMSNDPAVVKEIYRSHRQNFPMIKDERTALSEISHFFSPE